MNPADKPAPELREQIKHLRIVGSGAEYTVMLPEYQVDAILQLFLEVAEGATKDMYRPVSKYAPSDYSVGYNQAVDDMADNLRRSIGGDI